MENILGNVIAVMALCLLLLPLVATFIAHKAHKEDEKGFKKL